MITSMRAPNAGQQVWQGTVKIQRSIEPSGLVLIYNEARTILHQQPMPRKLEVMFFPGELKFYADATYNHGRLSINARDNREHEW